MPAATNPTRSTPVSAAAGSSGSAPDSGTSSSSSSSNSGFEQPGGQFNNSSAAADRITIGSIVRCVFESANMDFQGEVIAVEQKKVLMISESNFGFFLYRPHMFLKTFLCLQRPTPPTIATLSTTFTWSTSPNQTAKFKY